jgi:hypothetical protein
LLKLTFHPGTDMAEALAQTIGYANRARAFMPPGTVGPFIMRFDAGTVSVGYLVFSSESRSLGEIQDLASNRVRPQFATLPGLTSPPPFGGSRNARTEWVDVKTGLAAGPLIEVFGDLRAGDQIAARGSDEIRPGTEGRVKNGEASDILTRKDSKKMSSRAARQTLSRSTTQLSPACSCRPGMGRPMKRRRQALPIHRARWADHATRALSVAMPVFAYIWRYSFDMSTNASRARSDFTTRDRFHTARQL